MDDEFGQNEVLHQDCFISSSITPECDSDVALLLATFDPEKSFDDDFVIKTEPSDETSDYHGSSSGSPSSSLSSPHNEPLGLDLNFCNSFINSNFSPAPGSSHSPVFGIMNGGQGSQQHSPLPPVAHFSQMHHQQLNMQPLMHHQPQFQIMSNNNPNFVFKDSMFYEGIGGMGLAAAQQQLKARSKMHEMAVKQQLITDQSMQSNGDVHLSAEEKRTLLQEGYAIPSRLPLSKNEEEALKIVRRKIKNKLSAQESRRKRKEYLDALEIRVQGCVQENTFLKNRIRQLEAANRDLMLKVQRYEEGGQNISTQNQLSRN